MSEVVHFPRHRWHRGCPAEAQCSVCEGGLALCIICGGAEASLPKECPGERMPMYVQDLVVSGEADYTRRTGWLLHGVPTTMERMVS